MLLVCSMSVKASDKKIIRGQIEVTFYGQSRVLATGGEGGEATVAKNTSKPGYECSMNGVAHGVKERPHLYRLPRLLV